MTEGGTKTASGAPLDTYASSGFRFLIEIAAWIGGPWAAVDVVGAWWAAVPTALGLLLLPALFNTPGDKNTTGIPRLGRSGLVSKRCFWPRRSTVLGGSGRCGSRSACASQAG